GSVMTDAEENLWVASGSGGGAMRILKNGFVTFGRDDGLQGESIDSLFETRAGEICASSSVMTEPVVQCFDGRRFVGVHPQIPATAGGWQVRRRTLQAQDGSWWFGARQSLYHFPPVSTFTDLTRERPSAVYAASQGLRGNISGLFEDSRGDLWIWSETPAGYALSRWLRATNTIVPI